MKYVRVYESDYEQEYITTYQDHCEHVAVLQDAGLEFEGCIVKEADTIEELCDCYVIKDRDEHLPSISNTDFDYSNNKDKNNFDVYGAIWIGVNLKSVAKMNDEGELCLI